MPIPLRCMMKGGAWPGQQHAHWVGITFFITALPKICLVERYGVGRVSTKYQNLTPNSQISRCDIQLTCYKEPEGFWFLFLGFGTVEAHLQS